SWSTVQSSTATPTIGQSSRLRRSSRYSERKVITFARSPVIPKTTRTSAGCGCLPPVELGVIWGSSFAAAVGPTVARGASHGDHPIGVNCARRTPTNERSPIAAATGAARSLRVCGLGGFEHEHPVVVAARVLPGWWRELGAACVRERRALDARERPGGGVV